jgi:hypothetical protein
MKTKLRILPTAALLLAVVLPACDIKSPTDGISVRLNVRDEPVSLGAVGAVQVRPGQVTERSGTITGSTSIASVDALQAIKLQPSFFSFQAAAGDRAQAMASGTADVIVMSGQSTLLVVVVTVVNNVVTAVNPTTANGETMASHVRTRCAALNAVVPGTCARLGNAANLTADQLVASINAVLAAAQSPITVLVVPTSGDLSGSLQVSQFTVDATVTVR